MINYFQLIDRIKLLIQFYKVIGITEDELIIILILNQLLSLEKPFITVEEISELSNFDGQKIDKILAQLIKNKFLAIKTGKKAKMDLNFLWEKLFNHFSSISQPKPKTIIDEINVFLEVKLSSTQEAVINNWLENNLTIIDLKRILFAIETKKKKITFNDLENYINNFMTKKPKELIEFNWLVNE